MLLTVFISNSIHYTASFCGIWLFFVLYLSYADKGCSHICVCFIYCPTKHSWSTCNYERSQGNTDFCSFSNVVVKKGEIQPSYGWIWKAKAKCLYIIITNFWWSYGLLWKRPRCYGHLWWNVVICELWLACNSIDLSVSTFAISKVFHQLWW